MNSFLLIIIMNYLKNNIFNFTKIRYINIRNKSNSYQNGARFENLTCNQSYLLNIGYNKFIIRKGTKHGFYLYNTVLDMNVYYFTQKGFSLFMDKNYQKNIYRYPDEAYLISIKNKPIIVKIIEKKSQQTNGSMDTKLLAGPALQLEYQMILGTDFKVEYAFTINKFLQHKFESYSPKYQNIRYILDIHNIPIFYGEDPNYFFNINTWILNTNR